MTTDQKDDGVNGETPAESCDPEAYETLRTFIALS